METIAQETSPQTDKPLVVVAEDGGIQLRLTKMCLERIDCRVAAARDGEEALAFVRREKPALILLDVDMPKMNGFQVLDHLRRDPETRDIPVIMLTAHAKDSPLFAEWARPSDVFMTKPFSPNALLKAVNGLLAEHRSRNRPEAAGTL